MDFKAIEHKKFYFPSIYIQYAYSLKLGFLNNVNYQKGNRKKTEMELKINFINDT